MVYAVPLAAAFGCALCNGTAAILQKISADKQKRVNNLDARLLWRLAGSAPYILGAALDIIGWGLTLVAVHYLPLFLVESIIAFNIIVTATLEGALFRRTLGTIRYAAIAVVILGLIFLAISAAPEKVESVAPLIRWAMLLLVLPLAICGALLARLYSRASTIGIAILSGVAFGQTAVIGRIFQPYSPHWHNIYNPHVWSLVASGLLGILLFSLALQRSYATVTTATMTVAETLIPALIGVLFLGDGARQGLWFLAVSGIVCTTVGTLVVATGKHTTNADQD